MADYFKDLKNWRATNIKQHIVYVAIPEIGTITQKSLTGVQEVVDAKNRVLVSGTIGEQWVTTLADLCRNYTFADGSDINKNTLILKMDGNILKWTKVIRKSDEVKVWSCPVPQTVKSLSLKTVKGNRVANREGFPNLYGDFIIAANKVSKGEDVPNLARILDVVNGLVFPKTYNLSRYKGIFKPDITDAETIKPSEEPKAKEKKAVKENAEPKAKEKKAVEIKSDINKKAEADLAKIYKLFKVLEEKKGYIVGLTARNVTSKLSPKINISTMTKGVYADFLMQATKDDVITDIVVNASGKTISFSSKGLSIPTGVANNKREWAKVINNLAKLLESGRKETPKSDDMELVAIGDIPIVVEDGHITNDKIPVETRKTPKGKEAELVKIPDELKNSKHCKLMSTILNGTLTRLKGAGKDVRVNELSGEDDDFGLSAMLDFSVIGGRYNYSFISFTEDRSRNTFYVSARPNCDEEDADEDDIEIPLKFYNDEEMQKKEYEEVINKLVKHLIKHLF